MVERPFLQLNYLGRVDDPLVSQLTGDTRSIAKTYPQFSLNPRYFEVMTKRHEDTELQLFFAPSPELLALRLDLTELYNNLSLPQPVRFNPYVTYATANRHEILKETDYPLPEPIPVTHFILNEIMLSRTGTHYQRQAAFQLQTSQI